MRVRSPAVKRCRRDLREEKERSSEGNDSLKSLVTKETLLGGRRGGGDCMPNSAATGGKMPVRNVRKAGTKVWAASEC